LYPRELRQLQQELSAQQALEAQTIHHVQTRGVRLKSTIRFVVSTFVVIAGAVRFEHQYPRRCRVSQLESKIIADHHNLPPIWIAAQRDKVDEIAFWINCGQSVDSIAYNDFTPASPLYVAAHYGSLNSVKFLLEKGADINFRSPKRGNNALIVAANHGRSDVVKYLVERNVDVESRNNLGANAMYVASEKGHVKVVELLGHLRADLDAACFYRGTNAIERAAENGHLVAVEQLMEMGVRLQGNERALCFAIEQWNATIVKRMLEFSKGMGLTEVVGLCNMTKQNKYRVTKLWKTIQHDSGRSGIMEIN